MSSSLPWGRLYYEWAHDLKIQTLPEVFQRRHAMLLCMHIEGLLNPADEDAAFYMRLTLDEWLETKAAFTAKGLMDESNHLVNWERRQFKSEGNGAAARMRKYRNALRNGYVTVTAPDTDTESESESDAESEPEEGAPPPACGPDDAQGAIEPEPGRAARASSRPGRSGKTPPGLTIGEVLEIYASALPMLPPVQVVSPMMAHNFKLSLEKFPERRKGRDGRPFQCRLDWLLKDNNIADILNGKYPPDQGEERNGASDAERYGTEIRPLGSKGHAEKRG